MRAKQEARIGRKAVRSGHRFDTIIKQIAEAELGEIKTAGDDTPTSETTTVDTN